MEPIYSPALALESHEDSSIRIDAPDAELQYFPALLEPPLAERALAALRDEVDWEQHVVRIAGRSHPCPRLSAWQGDPGTVYTYSGLTLSPTPWHPVVQNIRHRVEQVSNVAFNSVLLNLYRDGNDGMGWHSDAEPELGPQPIIASVSLGAKRRFVLKHRRGSVPPVEIPLAHGSMLLMRGPTQAHWRHALPKTRRAVLPRINLTFRRIGVV